MTRNKKKDFDKDVDKAAWDLYCDFLGRLTLRQLEIMSSSKAKKARKKLHDLAVKCERRREKERT